MFESIMWTYIKEEKNLLLNLLKNNNVKDEIQKLESMEALYCVAHGSSYNAALSISSFITKMTGIRVYVYTPSNFENNALSIQYENKEKTCIMGISQTGTSRGVLKALEKVKDYSVLAITNEKDSPIDQLYDITYYLQCGQESSNAKTKGYSSTLLLLMIFGIELGFKRNKISKEQYNALYLELENEINMLDTVIDTTIEWCEKNQYKKDMKNLYVVGNGMNFGTAMEAQLKLMETHLIPTMFNDIIEFSHGMHRSLNSQSNVILLNSHIEEDLMNKTFDYCKEKEIPVCMITTQEKKDPDCIMIPWYENTHSILLFVVVIQVISAFVPEINGMDPNRNANDDYTEWMETRV